LIEEAYVVGPQLGLAVWTEDEAGPYQTAPYAGESWHPAGQPLRLAHEYLRHGTAKLLVLFEPASGQARVQGVSSTANAVLHPWMKQELGAVLEALPAAPPVEDAAANRRAWQRWQEGLRKPLELPESLPALRLLLVLDNLAGHLSKVLVSWMLTVGILPLYTPLGGSWLNMAESFQRILKRRALEGQHPQSRAEIVARLEQTAAGWNRHPTPFEWGGRRAERRRRERLRRHALGGSGAYTRRPVRWRTPRANQWQQL
jgi:transposase